MTKLQPNPKTKTQRLLEELAIGPSTAEELQLATGIKQSDCASYLTQWRKRGLVHEFGTTRSSHGMPITIWTLTPQKELTA